MTPAEAAELAWAKWALESAYRAGLTLPSALDLVLHVMRYPRVIVVPVPRPNTETPR